MTKTKQLRGKFGGIICNIDGEIKSISTYTIVEITYKDDTKSLHRQNTGFAGWSLLGILEFVKTEILQMLSPTDITFVEIKRKIRTKDSNVDNN
jgi:hypothetical protein